MAATYFHSSTTLHDIHKKEKQYYTQPTNNVRKSSTANLTCFIVLSYLAQAYINIGEKV